MYNQEKKADAGKDRWELLPINQIQKVVKVLTDGAERYGDNGWRSIDNPEDRFYAAIMRHLYAWRTGDKIDKESGMNHMIHVICNALFLSEFDDKNRTASSEELTLCKSCINNVHYARTKQGCITDEAASKCMYDTLGYPCRLECDKYEVRV